MKTNFESASRLFVEAMNNEIARRQRQQELADARKYQTDERVASQKFTSEENALRYLNEKWMQIDNRTFQGSENEKNRQHDFAMSDVNYGHQVGLSNLGYEHQRGLAQLGADLQLRNDRAPWQDKVDVGGLFGQKAPIARALVPYLGQNATYGLASAQDKREQTVFDQNQAVRNSAFLIAQEAAKLDWEKSASQNAPHLANILAEKQKNPFGFYAAEKDGYTAPLSVVEKVSTGPKPEMPWYVASSRWMQERGGLAPGLGAIGKGMELFDGNAGTAYDKEFAFYKRMRGIRDLNKTFNQIYNTTGADDSYLYAKDALGGVK